MFQAFSRSFAALSLLALLTAVVGIVGLLLGKREAVEREVGRLLPVLIFVVSLGATLGSLFYSEVMGFEPCRLCWYQRIAMYPIAFISGLALFRKDVRVLWYLRLQAIIGAGIGLYHYLIQQLESLGSGACTEAAPCSLRYVNEFGFVTIPFMAMSCFVLIAVASHYALTSKENEHERAEQ